MKTIEFYINPGVCEYGKHIFEIDDKLTEKEIKNYLKEWIWIKLCCEFHEVNSNPLRELQDKKALEQRILGTVVLEGDETPSVPSITDHDSPQNALNV